MRIVIISIIVVLVIGGVAAYYFLNEGQSDEETVYYNIGESDYQAVGSDLGDEIDNLSPTPPTEKDWTVTDIEFAKNSNLAYVTYHDTHNIFRILLEIHKTGGEYYYQVKATFEQGQNGWKKKFGEDVAAGRELIKISVN